MEDRCPWEPIAASIWRRRPGAESVGVRADLSAMIRATHCVCVMMRRIFDFVLDILEIEHQPEVGFGKVDRLQSCPQILIGQATRRERII